MMKNRKFIVIINLCVDLLLMIMVGTFCWMIIQASVGELVDYRAELIVPGVNVTVDMYALVDNEYILQEQNTTKFIELKNMEPGSIQRYRFDIKNPNDVAAGVKILFAGISGDVELLDDFLTINITSPEMKEHKLTSALKYDEKNNSYYMEFLSAATIPGMSTQNIYWNIELSNSATKEIEDTKFFIEKILFLNL